MKSFAERLRARDPMLGTLLRMPNEALVEMTALVGMDFVVIDTEHGPADQIPLSQHLTAATAAGIPALVRVGHTSEILRVLDLGAAGIIAPHISSVEQAEAVVRAAHYPPRGDRGFATYSRSGRQGLISTGEHLANARDHTAIVLMIEDGPGVAAAEQIAAVDGVDALFVGPADLSVALGFPGEQGHPHVRGAISDVHAAARRSGAAVVSITGTQAAAREHFESGSTMVIYNVLAALGGLFTSLAAARPGPTEGQHSDPPSAATIAPVILLPGMLATPELWEDVAAGIDPAVILRGIRTDLDDSIAGIAESVLAQAPERFGLVGHSLGGVVALEIARRAPGRLTKLALVNSSGRGPSDLQRQVWSDLADRTRQGAFADVVDEQAKVNLGPAADRPELVEKFCRTAHQLRADGFLRQLGAQESRAENPAELTSIDVPTLVVSGEFDAVCPPELQRELAAGIPRAVHVTLPQSGHMSPMDSPAELSRVLGEFFAR